MSDKPATTPITSATVLESITARIKAAHDDGMITNRAVDVFAERENSRRAKLLVDAVDKLTALMKAYDDINKPDGKHFASADPSAGPSSITYSEKRRGEIAKAKKNVDELNKAITDALMSASYDALEKALKKASGGGGEKPGSGSED